MRLLSPLPRLPDPNAAAASAPRLNARHSRTGGLRDERRARGVVRRNYETTPTVCVDLVVRRQHYAISCRTTGAMATTHPIDRTADCVGKRRLSIQRLVRQRDGHRKSHDVDDGCSKERHRQFQHAGHDPQRGSGASDRNRHGLLPGDLLDWGHARVEPQRGLLCGDSSITNLRRYTLDVREVERWIDSQPASHHRRCRFSLHDRMEYRVSIDTFGNAGKFRHGQWR